MQPQAARIPDEVRKELAELENQVKVLKQRQPPPTPRRHNITVLRHRTTPKRHRTTPKINRLQVERELNTHFYVHSFLYKKL